MRETLRVWAVVTFMILATVMQMNVTADANASKYLKENLEIAVHDAALFLDQKQLADGEIVFDQKKAYEAFVESLRRNAHLTGTAAAKGSFYQDPYTILSFKVIDDSNASFPYVFHHPLYDMDVLYEGPTIIVIVETYGPRYFSGQKKLIRRAASYTYKR